MITELGADIIIFVQFLIGFAAGLLIGFAMLRSKLTWKTGLLIGVLTAITFELVIGIVSWASFDQNLWWKELFASRGALIVCTVTIATSVVTSALVKAAKKNSAAKTEGKS